MIVRPVPVRLAHTFSSDLGVPWSVPYSVPLLERGWEVWNITPEGEHARCAVPAGMQWLPHRMARSFRPIDDVMGAVQLARYFARMRIDIVHTHSIKVGLVARVLAAAALVPIIVHTMHGLAFSSDTAAAKRHAHALLERVANAKVDAVLAQSREDAATLVASGAIAAERVVWIGNGIDLSSFDLDRHLGARERVRAALGVGRDEVLFLTGGRLVREKGIVELVQAASEARRAEPRVRLAIAGDPDSQRPDAISPAFLKKATDEAVIFLGRRDDMPELIAAADVVVLLSWREGLPRFLMEGAAMGKPLLGANSRGCREVVEDGVTGLLVPSRDTAAACRAMLTLARDPELRARLAGPNPARARDRYDRRQVVSRVVSVYDSLLEEKRSGRAVATSPPAGEDRMTRLNARPRPDDRSEGA